MSKQFLTIAVDVTANATIELPQGAQVDEWRLREIALRAQQSRRHQGQEVAFEPQWEVEDQLRIVCVTDEDGQVLTNAIPIGPQYFEGGQLLQQWLKGLIPLSELKKRATELQLASAENIRPDMA